MKYLKGIIVTLSILMLGGIATDSIDINTALLSVIIGMVVALIGIEAVEWKNYNGNT